MGHSENAATQAESSRNAQLVEFIATAKDCSYPEAVLQAARVALVDYLGVAIGAAADPAVLPARQTVLSWGATGKARIFLGPTTTPALAALVNASSAHAMDYDDTHPMGGGHPSGPCWSTALALADEIGASEADALAAFVTGYEIMAKLGGGGPKGVGRSLQRAGFHPTGVFGRSGAAAAASVLLGLDRAQIANALGAAATTAGGLLGSFGTHGKPYHAGRAALDGVLSAQLAANGFLASPSLYELDKQGGLLRTLLQREQAEVPPLDLGSKWELLGNGIKLFASCRGTHPSAQAAQGLAKRIGDRSVARVVAYVHPNSLVAAGNPDPKTGLEGKFSLAFCIALGLRGYRLVATDFVNGTLDDPQVSALIPKVELVSVADQPNYEAHVEVTLENGEMLSGETAIVSGHPDNPVSWDELESKFRGLVEPVAGESRATEILGLARHFDTQPGSLKAISVLLAI